MKHPKCRLCETEHAVGAPHSFGDQPQPVKGASATTHAPAKSATKPKAKPKRTAPSPATAGHTAVNGVTDGTSDISEEDAAAELSRRRKLHAERMKRYRAKKRDATKLSSLLWFCGKL